MSMSVQRTVKFGDDTPPLSAEPDGMMYEPAWLVALAVQSVKSSTSHQRTKSGSNTLPFSGSSHPSATSIRCGAAMNDMLTLVGGFCAPGKLTLSTTIAG